MLACPSTQTRAGGHHGPSSLLPHEGMTIPALTQRTCTTEGRWPTGGQSSALLAARQAYILHKST